VTEDHEHQLRRRLLAFAGLWFVLSGLLAALGFIDFVLVAYGVAILFAVLVVAGWLLHGFRVPQRLWSGLVATGRGARDLDRWIADLRLGARAKRRIAGLDLRARSKRLGTGAGNLATTTAQRAPGLVERGGRTYATMVYRSRARTAEVLRTGNERLSALTGRRMRPVDPRVQALRLNERGAELRRVGRHEEAAEHHRAALAIVRDLGDRQAEALTLNNLALALMNGGDLAAAVQRFEEALAVLRELGDEEYEGRVIANLGVVHVRQGHNEEAVGLLHEALDKLPPESSAYRQVEEQLRRAS
jgi:tetratricopeptide (TPR) repeat protein